MAVLVGAYIAVTLLVQAARFVKRYYVRRFANNINRRMKGVLYANLIRRSRAELENEGAGEWMTKAISDVDDCAEGMRKFTTEIFDTGVALVGYAVMLFVYDWQLALLCMIPFIGKLFALIYLLFHLCVLAFLPLFLGLVQSAFYEEITAFWR